MSNQQPFGQAAWNAAQALAGDDRSVGDVHEDAAQPAMHEPVESAHQVSVAL